ncbi:MAG: DUF4145 domain-containing protein [Patescibacteria group bacterium]|nr:DUF4145 domain-containing protein [Patescibacteria group bacterium]
MIPFTEPEFELTSFNCPHCLAYSNQGWYDLVYYLDGYKELDELRISICRHCGKYSLWRNGKMIYPEIISVESPNIDLSDDIKDDYNEAASILQKSARGAAAILRLALQKLCVQLGEKGKNINEDIANLVKKGLPVKIQQALDVVRVTGNESVHPGVIDLRDNQEIANKLFKLINFIAEKMVSEPKEVEKLYNFLPEEKREQIKKRDN